MVSDLEIILRLAIASVLGGLVGFEREIRGREAGIRTYLLVSLGSALIMVISQYFVQSPDRIAAQAISGIGFLGAGVILRYRDSIRGLTTAACMWVVCAIGLSIGSGHYLFGCVVSGMTIASLVGLKGIERIVERDRYKDLVIVSEDIEGQFERIEEIIRRKGIRVTNFSLKKDLGTREATIDFRLRFRTLQLQPALLNDVFSLPGIKSVELK